MIQNVLMVCVGNICRSPMAEGLLQDKLIQKDLQITVSSAGISALAGRPAAPFAEELMLHSKGINISTHRARQISLQILREAELILVMESVHQKEIEYKFPSICGRVHRLGKWSGFDIPDPYRRPKQIFEQTLGLIEKCVNDWQERLWK